LQIQFQPSKISGIILDGEKGSLILAGQEEKIAAVLTKHLEFNEMEMLLKELQFFLKRYLQV